MNSLVKSSLKRVLILLAVCMIWFTYSFIQDIKKSEAKKNYIKSLSFKLTGRVKKVSDCWETTQGVVFITNVKTNKQDGYQASFKKRYLFCKISKDKAILVGPASYEIQPNDSISINSDQLKCKIYRKGVLQPDYALYIYDDDNLYDYIDHAGWLDFEYYNKK